MNIVITVPEKEINEKRNIVVIQDLIAVVIALLVASLLTLQFTNIIVKPIKHLTEVSKKSPQVILMSR